MSNNEEIIKEVFNDRLYAFETIDGKEVKMLLLQAINFAREDERKNINNFIKARNTELYQKGFNKGCLETKEKIKTLMKEIIDKEKNRCGEANAYSCWNILEKELSCLQGV